MPFSRCTVNSTTFKMIDEEMLNLYPIDLYYCVDWDNLTIQGNFNQPEYKIIEIMYYRCVPSDTTNCSTDAAFTTWASKATVQQLITNSFF